MKKNVYVVLGMARSGTSVIARGLKALGVEFGDKLTAGDKEWNVKGFWEDHEIVYKINRGVLFALDYPLIYRPILDENSQACRAVADLKKAACGLLKQRIHSAQYWGFKDPRTAKLLPFWQEVFQETGVEEHYVIALRNPLSSAQSYQRLSGCDIEEALLMWLFHTVAAVEGTHGKNRVVVNFSMMMQDPHIQLNRVKLLLNIPDLSDAAEVDIYASEFLDKNLERYTHSDQELSVHPAMAVIPLCKKVYDLLNQLASDDLLFENAEFVDAWAKVMAEFNAMVPVYQYIDRLFKRNKQLERKIRNTQKSVLWRIFYPLYWLDDFFRQRRHYSRDKRRLIKSYE